MILDSTSIYHEAIISELGYHQIYLKDPLAFVRTLFPFNLFSVISSERSFKKCKPTYAISLFKTVERFVIVLK